MRQFITVAELVFPGMCNPQCSKAADPESVAKSFIRIDTLRREKDDQACNTEKKELPHRFDQLSIMNGGSGHSYIDVILTPYKLILTGFKIQHVIFMFEILGVLTPSSRFSGFFVFSVVSFRFWSFFRWPESVFSCRNQSVFRCPVW